jgi:hypothetical protein
VREIRQAQPEPFGSPGISPKGKAVVGSDRLPCSAGNGPLQRPSRAGDLPKPGRACNGAGQLFSAAGCAGFASRSKIAAPRHPPLCCGRSGCSPAPAPAGDRREGRDGRGHPAERQPHVTRQRLSLPRHRSRNRTALGITDRASPRRARPLRSPLWRGRAGSKAAARARCRAGASRRRSRGAERIADRDAARGRSC